MTSENAKREIAYLTRHAMDAKLDPIERAGALLIAHQRMDAGRCLCGWAELGKSHAGHQADELARAGLLAAADHHAEDVPRCTSEYEGWTCAREQGHGGRYTAGDGGHRNGATWLIGQERADHHARLAAGTEE